MRQPKIVIVGAGLVGGSAALFSAVAIPSAKIVIIDLERLKAEGQALDLAHAAAFYLAIWLIIGPLWWLLLGHI